MTHTHSAGATTTVFATPTATRASATGVAPSTTPKSDVKCPAINGTVHTVSASATEAGAGKQFRLLCGLDYGEGEAVDIGNVKTRNLEGCADACAARGNCTGAGWGVIDGDKGVDHACWMKTNLNGTGHNATAQWGFAVLLPDTEDAD